MNLKNNLPSGPITVKNGRLYIGTKEIFLYGVNFSWDAVTALSPVEFAQFCLLHGWNWIRFHKIAPGIDLLPYGDELRKVGIVFSIDIFLADRAVPFYEGDPATRDLFKQSVRSLKGLVAHPGLWLIQVCNEGATPMRGRPNMEQNLKAGYAFAKEVLRGAGFKGIIGDLPDANIHSEIFIPVIKEQEIVLAHGYGIHPQGTKYQEPQWAKLPHFYGVSQQIKDATGLPMVWQETGCCFPDARRHVNEAFQVSEAIARGASGVCFFQWASNHAQMRGEYGVTDTFSIATDPLRQLANIAGALMVKHRGLSQSTESQVEVNLGENTGSILIKPSPKKRVLIRLGRSSVEGFKSHDVGDNWKQIDSPGNSTLWHPEGKWIDVGAPISTAKQIDPRTLEVVASLQVKGNRVKLLQELCLVEVTLQ